MKGFRRAAGRRWHLLERGDTAVLPRGRAGTPVPPRHQRQAPGRHVGLGHRRRGQTPFSSVSYHLPWETVCGSPQVTGAREQSSDPSQLTPLSLRILFLGAGGEMEAGWRRRGGGGERQRGAPGRLQRHPRAGAPAGKWVA